MACEHSSQKMRDGKWVCRLCGEQVKKKRFDPSKLDTIKFGGLYAFKAMRDYGKTETEMTRDNLARYKKENPHKDPVRVDGKDRWI